MNTNHNDTLSAAKEKLRKNWEEGINCPCCGQLVKLYTRKINSGQAVSLIRLWWLCRDGQYHHYTEIKKCATDFAQLKRWGLIIGDEKNKDSTKRTSGMWKVTDIGAEFVKGEAYVRGQCQIYDDKTKGLTGAFVNIKDALGDKFDYSELMGFAVLK